MKVAHVVKRIEMIDEDIRQLKRLEGQLGMNKKYSNPIIMSIEKQINLLLAERIKYLELKIENPPAFMEEDEEKSIEKKEVSVLGPKVSRIRQRKRKSTDSKNKKNKTEFAKKGDLPRELGVTAKTIPDEMLTQEMIDRKFEEARKKLLEEADNSSDEKKKGISGTY